MNRIELSKEDEEEFEKMFQMRYEDDFLERPKFKTLTGVDRISNLPDPVIVHILSFLPTMKEAIRTGTLSKRWRYLWTSIPVLDFSNDNQNRPLSEFALFIDRTLNQCQHSKLMKLRVNFEVDYEPGFSSQLNRCIRYAVDSNAEELDIYFCCDPDLLFEFPQHALSNNSFTSLALANCIFVPNGLISWKLLKRLAITSSKLSEDLIRDMMVGSPVLEILELSFCWGFNRLDITSPSIKKFILDGYFEPHKTEDDAILEIYAPNILSLHIDGDLSLRKLLLFNMPSLIEASLTMSRYTENCDVIDEHADENMVKDLLQSLHHVNEITIGKWCMQIVSLLELEGWHSPLSKRKCLRFETFIRRSVFPGLSNLLHGSPDLETLHVNVDPHWYTIPCGSCTGENYLSQARRFQCLQQRLKIVKIDYYVVEWDRASELVQFLLGNACMLEKMVINCRSKAYDKSGSVTELMAFAFKLLSFPRASTNAVVLCPVYRRLMQESG